MRSTVRLAVLLSFLFSVTACQTSVRTTQDSYLTIWNQRLDQYRIDFTERDKLIQQRIKNVISTDLRTVPDPWRVATTRVFEINVMIREAFTVAGRGEMISAFIKHMNSNPPPGLVDVWFQQQVDDLRVRAQNVDSKTKVFFASFNEKVRSGTEWVKELGQLAMAQGMMQGMVEELQSLHKQAISYYGDIQLARAEDQRRAEQRAKAAKALVDFGMYINQLNYQQQLLNTLNRPRTCVFVDNIMTCN